MINLTNEQKEELKTWAKGMWSAMAEHEEPEFPDLLMVYLYDMAHDQASRAIRLKFQSDVSQLCETTKQIKRILEE